MRRLTIISEKGGVCDDLLGPVLFHRSALEDEYGFQIRICADGYRADDVLDSDMVWLQERRSHSTSIRRTLADIRSINPSTRLVYWDTYDSSYARFLDLTDTVDAYVRRNLFRDPGQHMQIYRCGRIFAEFISEYYDLPATWSGKKRVCPEDLRKLVLGWDIGWKCGSVRLHQGRTTPDLEPRSRAIDVCCRVGTKIDNNAWYVAHRRAALEHVRSLDDCKVLAAEQTIPKDEYLRELGNSRIAVSPFGWGEVCWRDFEAVVSGCLLVKPSMEHLRTYPFEYVDGETYVSVRWDLADLQEKCRYYLAHPDERLRITGNATSALDKSSRVECYARALELIDEVASESRAANG